MINDADTSELQIHVKEGMKRACSATGLGILAFGRLGNDAPTAAGFSARMAPDLPVITYETLWTRLRLVWSYAIILTRSLLDSLIPDLQDFVPGLGIVRVGDIRPCTYLRFAHLRSPGLSWDVSRGSILAQNHSTTHQTCLTHIQEKSTSASPFSLVVSPLRLQCRALASVYRPDRLSNRQNNDLLSSLAAKTSALKHVTLNIYDNARSQEVLDNTNETFSNMSTSIRGSADRLGRMAKSGDKMAILKLAAILVVTVVVLWWVLGLIWGLVFGR